MNAVRANSKSKFRGRLSAPASVDQSATQEPCASPARSSAKDGSFPTESSGADRGRGSPPKDVPLLSAFTSPPPTPPRGLCCRNGILHRAGAQGTVLLNWIDLSSLLKGPAWMFWNGFNSLPLLGLLRNFCCSHSRFSNNGFKTQGTLMRSYNPYTSPLLYHRGVLPSRLSTCVFRVCRSQPFHGNEPFHTRGFLPSHCPQPDEWRPFSGSLCIATQMWERVFSWTYELKENFQVLFKLNQWLRHSLYTVNVTLFNVWFCPPAFTVM